MADIKKDPFEEYIRQTSAAKKDIGYAWKTAIGLQSVDGISTSDYLKETAVKNIDGEISIDEAENLLNAYYKENVSHSSNDRTEEADKVAVRIAAILSEQSFNFTPAYFISIHKRLFEGSYKYAGKIRDYNITKKEWVLDGNTVIYGSAYNLRETLEYDFNSEKSFSYTGLSNDEIIKHIASFISNLWQIHIFGEGNTRTTAVFLIKYLKTLGYDVTNDLFSENAWYFRNALVRANYSDIKNNIYETTEYLELFLRNLLFNEKNELHNRNMHISGLLKVKKQDIGAKKQDIGVKKQDIGAKKQDIGVKKQDIGAENSTLEQSSVLNQKLNDYGFKRHFIKNVNKLFDAFGDKTVFGRTEVMNVLNITSSPASEILKRMKNSGIIVSENGLGKGKYKFEL